ncbi:MAG: hypothetical protein ACYCPS_03670 [Candidatus Saccharimonadales bacterium]
MLLAIILGAHVFLSIAVSIGFVYRYIILFKNKEYPQAGRKSVYAGSAGLIITGVLLAGIGKLPITSLCLDSLGIIVALIILEVGLIKIPGKLASVRNNSNRD